MFSRRSTSSVIGSSSGVTPGLPPGTELSA